MDNVYVLFIVAFALQLVNFICDIVTTFRVKQMERIVLEMKRKQIAEMQKQIEMLGGLKVTDLEEDGSHHTRTFREIAECQQEDITEKSSA